MATDESILKRFPCLNNSKNANDIKLSLPGHLEENIEIGTAKQHKHLNVALLLTGMPRSFLFPIVFDSIKKHLIEGMTSSWDDATVIEFHIFINFVLDDTPRHFEKQLTVRMSPSPTLAELVPAFHALGSVRLVRVSKADSPTLNESLHTACRGDIRPPPNFSMSWMQHVRSWETFQMMRGYELQQNIQMDWVMRIRPDMYWFNDVPPVTALDPNMLYVSARSNMVSDHYIVVPREMAFDVFSLGLEKSVCSDGSPERILEKHLKKTGHPQKWIDWLYAIVRYHEGAECWKLNDYKRRWCESVFGNWTSNLIPSWVH
jgi:hypothetical protein